MKKLLPILIALLVVGGAAAYMLTKDKDETPVTNQTNTTTTTPQTQAFNPPDACTVLTLDDAKKVLGNNAEKTDVPGGGAASSTDIAVTQCYYSQPSGDTIDSIKAAKQASILVRGAKTQVGADSNDQVFNGSLKPATAQTVTGYGDGAYWYPELGQLNIYKNGNWYILTVGTSSPSDHKLDDAKKLADLIIDRL